MREEMTAVAGTQLTRRAFMARVAVAGAVASAAAVIGPAESRREPAAACESRGTVASFHMDRLYLDTTGLALPYHPPAGARGAAPVAHLSEEAFRSRHCYV